MPQACPLCHCEAVEHFHTDKRRDYLQCRRCALVFVPVDQLPSPAQERAEYDKHQNDADDEGYRRFLSRLCEPLVAQMPAGSSGLDFGCGPGPTLHLMLVEAGMNMAIYDPLYFPDEAALEQQYDFICATEVFEHLHQPGETIAMLLERLNNGGLLAVMTKRVLDREAFSRWHYKNDPTHVCFFAEHSFQWLADKHGLELDFPGPDTCLLKKRS